MILVYMSKRLKWQINERGIIYSCLSTCSELLHLLLCRHINVTRVNNAMYFVTPLVFKNYLHPQMHQMLNFFSIDHVAPVNICVLVLMSNSYYFALNFLSLYEIHWKNTVLFNHENEYIFENYIRKSATTIHQLDEK